MAAQQPSDALWVSSWTPSNGEETIRKKSMTDESDASCILYCSWFCPYAQRAWIALEELGISYRYIEINPYEVDVNEPGGYTKKQLPLPQKEKLYPDFVATSPRGLVPAVDHSGRKVWESLCVVEYVDNVFGQSKLLPTDSHKRALARIWMDHAESRIQKSYYTMLMAQDPEQQKKAMTTFLAECRKFAQAMGSSGPFFLGENFSMVDIALAPFWQRILWVGKHYRNLTLPHFDKNVTEKQVDPDFQRLAQWWEAVSNRPSVKSTFVCKERLIASYSQYARNVGTSDYAKNLQSSLTSGKGKDSSMCHTSSLLAGIALGVCLGYVLAKK
eukprot:m.25511 g.25511  ORF g.25511 m.25511 type:complete len:329 (-) comp7710_c0_seq2:48-1034(-)